MMLGAGKPRLRLNDTISLRDDRRCASKPPTKRACKACAAAGPLPHLDRAFKLLTFLVGQCHDDRIFTNAKELGGGVIGIAED